MRFISKSSNLLIVLKPGLSAQPLTGTPSIPTVSVKFKEGLAEVPEGELVEMMLRHPGYGGDFISAESVANVDPYAYTRAPSEPEHVVTELKFGSPVARHVEGGNKNKLPPEMAKLVQDMATSMAKEMVKEMLPATVESVLKSLVKDAPAAKAKGKPGRKPGRKASVAPQVSVPSAPVSTGNPAAVADAA